MQNQNFNSLNLNGSSRLPVSDIYFNQDVDIN